MVREQRRRDMGKGRPQVVSAELAAGRPRSMFRVPYFPHVGVVVQQRCTFCHIRCVLYDYAAHNDLTMYHILIGTRFIVLTSGREYKHVTAYIDQRASLKGPNSCVRFGGEWAITLR